MENARCKHLSAIIFFNMAKSRQLYFRHEQQGEHILKYRNGLSQTTC